MLFPRPLLSLYACICHVLLCVLCLTNIGFVPVLFSRFPFKKFVRLCLSRFVMRTLPHKHRVCDFPSGSPFLNVCTVIFVTFCYAYFPSQTLGLCSAFPSASCWFVRLPLSCYAYFASQKHQFCAVLFSRLPFKFSRLYWSCFVVRVFRFTRFCGIHLVNAGFVVVAGCFYSHGSACFMYLFLYFNICIFAFSCVICVQFGVLLFPCLLLLQFYPI